MKNLFKKEEGALGEAIACNYLKKLGYKIIDRNFRIRGGEIDIIALEGLGKDAALVFIEVKTRRSTEFGTPFEAISYFKLKSLIKTAQFYKMKHPQLPESMRIDAVGILLNNRDLPEKIELVKNISS